MEAVPEVIRERSEIQVVIACFQDMLLLAT